MIEIFEKQRVLEFTMGMAGSLAGMMFADHGADVVKVEPNGGEFSQEFPAYLMWNRGKRSIQADFDNSKDLAQIRELILGADVVLAADVDTILQKCSLSRDELLRLNKGIITCSISSLGETSSVDYSIYEGTLAALTGRMSGLDQLSGRQPGPSSSAPTFTAAPIASFGASQLAVQGIVAAMLQRSTTSRGRHIATSLVQGAMAFVMRQELGRNDGTTKSSGMSRATHRGIELCFLTAECSDGRYIQMCARQDKHFQDFMRALGQEELLKEPRYRDAPMGIATVEDVDELEAILRRAMKTKTQAEWMDIFTNDYDIGSDPFLTPVEFLHHPDMVLNDRIVEINNPGIGLVRQIGSLVAMSITPAVINRPAPRKGDYQLDDNFGWHDERLEIGADCPANGELPLDGITILEVAYYIAGPLATAILAEMGARVIKVEPLEGDPYRRTGLQSAKFLHGKESLTLDLKSSEGKEILATLIKKSDVVVHSFRESAAKKLNLSASAVHTVNPQAVHLYAASYGSGGPQADRAAFHSTPNALTGGGIKQAGVGNPPVNDSYADPGSALGAATAILFGLWAREQMNGAGQALETTMLTSTGYIHSSDMVCIDGVVDWKIADSGQHGLNSLYRIYETLDGHIFVSTFQDHEKRALFRVLNRLELLNSSDQDVATALEKHFRTDTTEKWIAMIHPTGIGVVAVNPETFDKWLEENGWLLPMEHSLFGKYWRLREKLSFHGSKSHLGNACSAGEQSIKILQEIGYSDSEIEELILKRVSTDGRIKI